MKKPLTQFEWTLLYMAVRYAMGRQSIASATLPAEIVENIWDRLSENQKGMLYCDLKAHYGKTKKLGKRTVRQIRYLRDIPSAGIKAGDVGGWIQSEKKGYSVVE